MTETRATIESALNDALHEFAGLVVEGEPCRQSQFSMTYNEFALCFPDLSVEGPDVTDLVAMARGAFTSWLVKISGQGYGSPLVAVIRVRPEAEIVRDDRGQRLRVYARLHTMTFAALKTWLDMSLGHTTGPLPGTRWVSQGNSE